MRFVVGLCFGSLLVLAAAALLDWPGTRSTPFASAGLDSAEPIVREPDSPSPAPQAEQTPVETAAPNLDTLAPASATHWPSLAESTAAGSSVPTVESDSAELATEATATLEAEVDAATEDYPAPDALPQVAVWRPFHSQMSAQGFAKRLSLQLGYPFSVVKVDAARYHVVFSYEDTAERDLLAEQLTALTGYSPK